MKSCRSGVVAGVPGSQQPRLGCSSLRRLATPPFPRQRAEPYCLQMREGVVQQSRSRGSHRPSVSQPRSCCHTTCVMARWIKHWPQSPLPAPPAAPARGCHSRCSRVSARAARTRDRTGLLQAVCRVGDACPSQLDLMRGHIKLGLTLWKHVGCQAGDMSGMGRWRKWQHSYQPNSGRAPVARVRGSLPHPCKIKLRLFLF